MGTWSKPKRFSDTPQAYAVYPVVGCRYGVGLFRVGARNPEHISSIAARASEEKLQRTVDRLNSRIGVTREQAVLILAEWRSKHMKGAA